MTHCYISIDRELKNKFYRELINFSNQSIYREEYELELGGQNMIIYDGNPVVVLPEDIEGLSKANKDVTIRLDTMDGDEVDYYLIYKNGILIDSS